MLGVLILNMRFEKHFKTNLIKLLRVLCQKPLKEIFIPVDPCLMSTIVLRNISRKFLPEVFLAVVAKGNIIKYF